VTAFDNLKAELGFYALPVPRPDGVWVRGYQSIMNPQPRRPGIFKPISERSAEDALRRELQPILAALTNEGLSGQALAAFAMLGHDIGLSALLSSHALRAWREGKHKTAGLKRAQLQFFASTHMLPDNAPDLFLEWSFTETGKWDPSKFNRRWRERLLLLTTGSTAAEWSSEA
jgi:hypothetical protein